MTEGLPRLRVTGGVFDLEHNLLEFVAINDATGRQTRYVISEPAWQMCSDPVLPEAFFSRRPMQRRS